MMRRINHPLIISSVILVLSPLLNSASARTGRQASISGSVFDLNGRAGFQMEVRLLEEDVLSKPDSVFAEHRTYTYVDQQGLFRFEGVNPGRYILAVNADFRFPYRTTFYPGAQDLREAEVITIGSRQTLRNLQIGLGEPSLVRRSVRGVVKWADGTPAVDAYVNLLVEKYPWIAPSAMVTNEKGEFSLTGFEGVKYLVHAWGRRQGEEERHAGPVDHSFVEGVEPLKLELKKPGKGLPVGEAKQ